MTAQERIDAILKDLNTNPTDLASKIGINKHRIYDLHQGRTIKFNVELAEEIVRVFPIYNKDWMLHGKGDMKVDVVEKKTTNTEKDYLSIIKEQSETIVNLTRQLESEREDMNRTLKIIENLTNKQQRVSTSYMVAEDI